MKYLYKYIFILFACIFFASCGHKQSNVKTEQESKPKEKTLEQIMKEREDDYDFLCLIGEDRWGSFDAYNDFISIEGNGKLLDQELELKGYDSFIKLELHNAQWMIDLGLDTLNKNRERVEYDWYYVAWLFIKMREADVNTGSYIEFKQRLLDEDGFVWCYDKSRQLGLVDSWHDFIMQILEPNFDECRYDFMEYIEGEGYIIEEG